LKQVEVATHLDVPQSFVSKYETGQRRLDLVDLQAVCKAVGINIPDLIILFEAELKKVTNP
jgi:transcriptional regulator with XRE-family HTH domain